MVGLQLIALNVGKSAGYSKRTWTMRMAQPATRNVALQAFIISLNHAFRNALPAQF